MWDYYELRFLQYLSKASGYIQRLFTKNRPLHINQTEKALQDMMIEAGQNLDSLELEKTWDVFKKFCELPIETVTDAALIQWGVRLYYEGVPGNYKVVREEYYFSFLRQVENDFMEYEQIECQFDYEIDDSLRELGSANKWCFFDNYSKRHKYADSDCNLREFLEKHQEGKIFQTLKNHQPIRTKVIQQSTD